MFYLAFRAVASLLLKLFFRVEAPSDPHDALALKGPVIFVGNHPNGLIDPGLVFVLAKRQVTFLAKAPLFGIPVLGAILRGLGALPVYRKQDGADTAKNEGMLKASVDALVSGRALSIFPEGKSHSDPQLAELKTGCARIALDAVARGADLRIVPVGLTYSDKNRFKSRVRVEVGEPLLVRDFASQESADAVRTLTQELADRLRAVTLNLERWEDLPILRTAEALYALERGEAAGDAERHKAFAKGMAVLRDEQPARFEQLKRDLAAFGQRLELLQVTPDELTYRYRVTTVARFVVQNLLWLLGVPIWLCGMALFAIPYWIPIALVAVTRPKDDTESTVKVLTLMVLAPVWWAALTIGAWLALGAVAAVATFFTALPLALFTRWYLERRRKAFRDARVFLIFWSRRWLKERLLTEGRLLALQIDAVAEELRPRVTGRSAASPTS